MKKSKRVSTSRQHITRACAATTNHLNTTHEYILHNIAFAISRMLNGIRRSPAPTPSHAAIDNVKLIQKATIATKSIRFHECLRYGTFRSTLLCAVYTLSRKGRPRYSFPSEV